MAVTRVRAERLRPVALSCTVAERRLRWAHLAVGVAVALQALAVAAVGGSTVALTVSTAPAGGPGPVPLDEVGRVAPATVVVAMLALAAGYHLVVASGRGFAPYLWELRHRRNRFRWAHHAVVGALAVVAAALVAGVGDVSALAALAAATAAAALLAWHAEADGAQGSSAWGMGLAVASVPVGAVVARAAAQGASAAVAAGAVTAWMVLSAANQGLQRRGVGPWRRYELGEAIHLALTGCGITVVAWVVVAVARS